MGASFEDLAAFAAGDLTGRLLAARAAHPGVVGWSLDRFHKADGGCTIDLEMLGSFVDSRTVRALITITMVVE